MSDAWWNFDSFGKTWETCCESERQMTELRSIEPMHWNDTINICSMPSTQTQACKAQNTVRANCINTENPTYTIKSQTGTATQHYDLNRPRGVQYTSDHSARPPSQSTANSELRAPNSAGGTSPTRGRAGRRVISLHLLRPPSVPP